MLWDVTQRFPQTKGQSLAGGGRRGKGGLRDMRDIPKTAWKEASVIFVIFKVVIVFILLIISIIIVTVAVIFITIIILLVLY